MPEVHQKFLIGGMSCASCAAHVEKAARSVVGVKSATVNLLSKSLEIDFDASQTTPDSVVNAVVAAGYEASTEIDEVATTRPDYTSEWRRRFWWSALFLVGLIVLAHLKVSITNGGLQLLALGFISIINISFFTRGFKSLFKLAPNMDSLVAIGSTAGILYSIFELIKLLDGKSGVQLYFEASGMILTLIALGKFLEAKATSRTGDAIAKLISMSPPTALVERDGKEQEIALKDLLVGDVAVIKSGSKLPADGVIIDGFGVLDESAITGESVPKDKKVNDKVYAGTINREGFLRFKVERVGADSTLGIIIKLVENASGSKAPVAKMADRIAGVFVPIVIAIAVVSALVWLLLGASWLFALTTLIAVLLISCPCALGLATPVAIMVGIGVGAKNGILFKNAESLEKGCSIDVAVMDKTGTLTTGIMELNHVIPTTNLNPEQVLALAASLEKLSEHPLAQAIVRAAEKKGLKLLDTTAFHATPGEGIEAEIDGKTYLIGNAVMLKRLKISDAAIREKTVTSTTAGQTILFLVEHAQVIGVLSLSDEAREDSRTALDAFRRCGLKTIMLTGDNEATAFRLQSELKIDEVFADLLPQDKAEKIKKLQRSGYKVAMIGDGVNDAPGLAQADLGIAIGAGTDVAIEVADVVLIKNSLLDAVTALELSRHTMRNIKENLFWAFFYNALGIPLATGLFYSILGWQLHPVFGAAAMSLSSVFVVGNSLRLKSFRPSFARRTRAQK